VPWCIFAFLLTCQPASTAEIHTSQRLWYKTTLETRQGCRWIPVEISSHVRRLSQVREAGLKPKTESENHRMLWVGRDLQRSP